MTTNNETKVQPVSPGPYPRRTGMFPRPVSMAPRCGWCSFHLPESGKCSCGEGKWLND